MDRDDYAKIIITPNAQTAKITIRTNRKRNFRVNNSTVSILDSRNKILKAHNSYLESGTFNMIPTLKKFTYLFRVEMEKEVEIPIGSNDLKNLIKTLNDDTIDQDNDAEIVITSNAKTSKITIQTNRKMNFRLKNSIGNVLGLKIDSICEPVLLIQQFFPSVRYVYTLVESPNILSYPVVVDTINKITIRIIEKS